MKICGLTRVEDARLAEEAGADYLGFVLSEGFGRSVALADAPALVAGLGAARVAVVVDEAPGETARRAEAIGADVVQLHGAEDREVVQALRGLGPWTLWKAVRARSVDDLRRVVSSLGDLVDGFLVEGWKPGVVGGGGASVNLDGAEVRAALPPGPDFVLAGGLDPDNVAAAVARFAPDVVDVSSGVERAARRKDPELVRAFVRAAREARR